MAGNNGNVELQRGLTEPELGKIQTNAAMRVPIGFILRFQEVHFPYSNTAKSDEFKAGRLRRRTRDTSDGFVGVLRSEDTPDASSTVQPFVPIVQFDVHNGRIPELTEHTLGD